MVKRKEKTFLVFLVEIFDHSTILLLKVFLSPLLVISIVVTRNEDEAGIAEERQYYDTSIIEDFKDSVPCCKCSMLLRGLLIHHYVEINGDEDLETSFKNKPDVPIPVETLSDLSEFLLQIFPASLQRFTDTGQNTQDDHHEQDQVHHAQIIE